MLVLLLSMTRMMLVVMIDDSDTGDDCVAALAAVAAAPPWSERPRRRRACSRMRASRWSFRCRSRSTFSRRIPSWETLTGTSSGGTTQQYCPVASQTIVLYSY